MGSYGTLVRQCLLLAVLVGVIAWFAPAEARLWVAGAGAVGLAFFAVVSVRRHRQIMGLAREIDEVLHNGRRVDFTTCREGDVAILSSELAKMVARLTRTRDSLESERNALSDALADVSHQIRTPLTAIGLMLPVVERADEPRERRRAVRELEAMLDETEIVRSAALDELAAVVPKSTAAAVYHHFHPGKDQEGRDETP